MSAYSDYLDGKAGAWVGGWGEVGYVHAQLEKQRAQQQSTWAQPVQARPSAPSTPLFDFSTPKPVFPVQTTTSQPFVYTGGTSGTATSKPANSDGFLEFVEEFSDWAFADFEQWLDRKLTEGRLAIICVLLGFIAVMIALSTGIATWSFGGVILSFLVGGASLPVGYVGLRIGVALATFFAILAFFGGIAAICLSIVVAVVKFISG